MVPCEVSLREYRELCREDVRVATALAMVTEHGAPEHEWMGCAQDRGGSDPLAVAFGEQPRERAAAVVSDDVDRSTDEVDRAATTVGCAAVPRDDVRQRALSASSPVLDDGAMMTTGSCRSASPSRAAAA